MVLHPFVADRLAASAEYGGQEEHYEDGGEAINASSHGTFLYRERRAMAALHAHNEGR
jgi:hypothetical protein